MTPIPSAVMARQPKPKKGDQPNKGGRPSRIHDTPTRAKFVSMLRAGSWITEAAAAVGWPPRSVEDWLARGRLSLAACERDDTATPDEPYHGFASEVAQVQAEAEILLLGLIGRAARGDAKAGQRPDWKAAAWMLEKRNPGRYGQRVQLAGDPSAPLAVVPVSPGLSDADKAARAAEVLAALAGLGADPTIDALPVDKLVEERKPAK